MTAAVMPSAGAEVDDLQRAAGVEGLVPARSAITETQRGVNSRWNAPGAASGGVNAGMLAPASTAVGTPRNRRRRQTGPVEFARAPVHHRIAGRQVLVLGRDGRPTTLDGLAADVWTMLSEPAELTDIEAVLADHYGPDPALRRAANDAVTMLGDLLGDPAGRHRRGGGGVPLPPTEVLGPGSLAELERIGVPPRDAVVAVPAMQWSVGRGPQLEVPADEWSGVERCSRERIIAGLAEAVRRARPACRNGCPTT